MFVPLLPMALEPALRYGSYKRSSARKVEMFGRGVLEAPRRVRVWRKGLTHARRWLLCSMLESHMLVSYEVCCTYRSMLHVFTDIESSGASARQQASSPRVLED